MFKAKNGLGDADFREVGAVAEKINQLEVGNEISFTIDSFESEQLYDTVLDGLKVAGFVCILNCGVYRWFLNEDDDRSVVGDFRNDIIILERGKDYDKGKKRK